MNGFDIFPFASFLILIFLISGKVFFLKRNGVKVSSNSGKPGTSALFIYAVFPLIIFICLWEIVKPAFHLSDFFLPEFLSDFLIDSAFVKIAGVLVTGFSLILMMLTLLHFKNSLRFGLNEKNLGKLVTNGIFSVSRNPFFLSLDLYFLGIAFLLPNLFFIGFAVLTIVSIHFFILKEEKFMRSVYGDEYVEYQRKVRRYLSFY